MYPDALPAVPATAGRVWACYDPEANDLEGFLVTDRDDVDRPFALVRVRFPDPWWAVLADPKGKAAMLAAREIAADPEQAGRLVGLAGADGYEVIDLREYARLDSPRPTPERLYHYVLAPAGNGPQEAGFRCCPVCRFRFARMIGQFVRMRFRDDQRVKWTGGISVGLEGDGMDAGRNINSGPVAIDPSQIPLPR